MLVMGTDHVTAASGSEAMLLVATPLLWIVGVIVFVAFKLRSR